ncbi:hypothetical protein C3941_01125 [Kaistia algarum]|uniref:GumC family protein n=1 Tax=Kaistia algarum TaxID=2083279 RepID=UPI000CE766A2|nr:exopolysaccharide transport family protein [Kaistia algarum]PPE81353.1 hypothetical protein C3941_01125 [Kaistia algarum]
MVATLSGALDRRLLSVGGPMAADAPSDMVDLGVVFGLLLRRWWIIALVVAVFLGGGLAYVAVATKIYSATTRVLLDPRDKQIVGTDLTGPSQGTPAGWIETQVDLVTAFATLKNVVLDENLIDDPEFGGTGQPADLDAVVRSLAEHVRAERTADTYVVDVIVSSVSAQKAARLSLAVAEAFIQSSTEAKQNTARQANDLILRQVDDLKAKAREADQRVQRYREEHGLIQIDGKPVDEQTLAQLNEANNAARLKADQSEERWSKIDALSRTGGNDFGAALDNVDSGVLGRLKLELAIVQKQQAELADTLGSRHPKMTALNAEVERTRGLIVQELKNLSARAKIDADLARSQAAATATALARATQQVNDSSQASVELRELEGDAAIRRDVYKAFVSRAQETGLQENLQVPDVRVISPAQVPLVAAQPKKSVILALSLIGGLGCGISLALYLGRPRRSEAPDIPPERIEKVLSPSPPETLPAAEIIAILPVPAPLAGGAHLTPAEAADGMADFAEGAADAMDALLARLTQPQETDGPVVRLLFGTAAPGAIASIAAGLAGAVARDGAETLLVDANAGAINAGTALIGPDVLGVLDVELDGVPTGNIGARLAGTSVVLLPAASADLRHKIAAHGERLAETVEDVADGFAHIVIDLGAACPPELFQALSPLADDVLMVVDAAEAGREDILSMFDDLQALVPNLRGMIAVRAVPVAVADSVRTRG